jgi:hypothetical protein
MEDAKISESTQNQTQNPFNYVERFPTIIDSDDITFNIGKLTLAKINGEKILDNLLKKNQEINKVLNDLNIKSKSLEERNFDLDKSNKLYQEHNKKLDNELTNTRNELNLKTEQLKIIPELNKEIEILKIDKENLNQELIDTRNELNKEIEILKIDKENLIKKNKQPIKKQIKPKKSKPLVKKINKKVIMQNGGEW